MHIIGVCLLIICLPELKGWQIGKNLVYEYRFKNTLISNERYYSTGTFQAKWDSQESFTGRLIPEEWNYGRGIGSPLPDKTKPFRVTFKNSQVAELEVTPTTTKWQIEFIRGIVSLLQVSDLIHKKDEFSVTEESVTGRCETRYSVQRKTPISVITKTKDYTNCQKIPVFQRGIYGRNYDALMKKRDVIARNTTATIALNDLNEIVTSSIVEMIQIISAKSSAEFISETVLHSENSPTEITDDDFKIRNSTSVGGLMYQPENIRCNKDITFGGKKILNYCERNYYMNLEDFDTSYPGPKIEIAKKLVEKLAEELKALGKLSETNAPDRFSVLLGVVRQMSLKELKETSKIWIGPTDGSRFVFENAIAACGTLDCLKMAMDLKRRNSFNFGGLSWLKLAGNVHPLSLEYLDTLFDFATDSKLTKTDFEFSKNLYLVFNNLLRRYLTEKEKPFADEELQTLISKKYRPYLSGKLEEALDYDDDLKFQIYVRALGNMADLSLFDHYLSLDSDDLTSFQKIFLVTSMDKAVQSYPVESRKILMRVFESSEENFTVRVASAFKLFETDLPQDLVFEIIRIAAESNNENIKNAVAITIFSKAYNYHTNQNITDKAEEMPLFQNFVENYGKVSTHMAGDFSDDKIKSLRIIERVVGLTENPYSISYEKKFDRSGFKSSLKVSVVIANILKSFDVSFSHLGLPEDGSGAPINFELATDFAQFFLPFDKFKMDVLQLLLQNHHLEKSFFDIEEVSIAFPTESGLPFLYSYQSPSYLSLEATASFFKLNFDLRFLRSEQEQIKMGFVNPLTGEFYLQGLNIERYVDLPLSFSYSSEKSVHKITIDPLFRDGKQKYLHLATLPYAGIREFFPVVPLASDKGITFLKSDDPSNEKTFSLDTSRRFTVNINSPAAKTHDYYSTFKSLKSYVSAYNYTGPFGEVEATHNEIDFFFKEDKSSPTSLILKLDLEKVESGKIAIDVILTGPIQNVFPTEFAYEASPSAKLLKMSAKTSRLADDFKFFETCLDISIREVDQILKNLYKNKKNEDFDVFVKLRFGLDCDEGAHISLGFNVNYLDVGKRSHYFVNMVVDFDRLPDRFVRRICEYELDFLADLAAEFNVIIKLTKPEKCKNFVNKGQEKLNVVEEKSM